MRRALLLLTLVLGLGLVLTALLRTGPEPPQPVKADIVKLPRQVAPSGASVEYVGRFDATDPDAPRFAWPASQLRVRFSGSGIRVRLRDIPVPDETRETDRLGVEIDGERRPDLALAEGSRLYDVASGLAAGTHTLVLTKLTEAEVGTITLQGFELTGAGELLPALPSKARWMEVIGDSISAGYGVLGPNAACPWSAKDEDALRTYGAVAARALGANLVLEAWSGKGVFRNFRADDPETMLELFERVLPAEPSSARTPLPQLPELVVINLGTNDLMRGKPPARGFLRSYRELLERARQRAPKAAFVLVLSPLLADDFPFKQARSSLREWVQTLAAERRKRGERVAVLEQWVDPKEGLGCDGHPSQATQARLGAELAQAVRDQLGW